MRYLRGTPLAGLARRFLEDARRRALQAEDIVPSEVHHFDRTRWVIKELEFGARIWCSLNERAISRPILLNAYEPAETRFIAMTVRPGDLAVDAGANIGYHTLHLAHLAGEGGHVEAFEPIPYLAQALAAGVAESAFTARVTVHRAALDERPGTLQMRRAQSTSNFGGAYFAPGDVHPDEVEVAAVLRLDDVIAGRSCRFLKMDVEGAEPRVIRGGLQTLMTGRPVILSELHNPQLQIVSQTTADAFIAQLSALGYRCSRLNPDGTRGHALERYADLDPVNVVFDPVAAARSGC